MPLTRSAGFALVALALAAVPARAQDARTIDVTPYVAVGTEGASPVGVAVTVPMTSTCSVERDVA
jgi:hypothetical protein